MCIKFCTILISVQKNRDKVLVVIGALFMKVP